jgi:hypothetical protein
MPQQEEGKITMMGRVAPRVMGKEARKFLRVKEAMGMAMGGGGKGNGQDGGGQAPLAYNNAAGFLAAWNTAPSDQAKNNLEQEAINRSPAQDVHFAAMMKINLRLQATVGQLTNRVNQAQGQGQD